MEELGQDLQWIARLGTGKTLHPSQAASVDCGGGRIPASLTQEVSQGDSLLHRLGFILTQVMVLLLMQIGDCQYEPLLPFFLLRLRLLCKLTPLLTIRCNRLQENYKKSRAEDTKLTFFVNL